MSEPLSKDQIRQIVGTFQNLSDRDADELAGWYSSFEKAVAAFPADDLKRVEPPLRSIAGPVVR